MHVYLYDTYVMEKKFESTVARIETRITDLGLNGKIIRRGNMNSVFHTIDSEIKKGAKTIIAVGDNQLLSQAISALAKIVAQNPTFQNIPLGFIPIGKKNNDIALYLGLGLNEDACDVLSARRIQKLDLGRANENYFLTSAVIGTQGTTVEIDENYSIEITEPGDIEIINLPVNTILPEEINSVANDNVLELYINTRPAKKFLPLATSKNQASIFSFKKLLITNKEAELVLDQVIAVKTPVEITIAPVKINLIVGKNRNF